MLKITISQAIDGYLLDANARHLSPCTINDYSNGFRHLMNFIKYDPLISDIDKNMLQSFFIYLGNEKITPKGCTKRPTKRLSKKTILNVHTALCALWTWALDEGFVDIHIPHLIDPPKPEIPAIIPFSKDDIISLLDACATTKTYSRPGKRSCSNSRPTALRDKSIILTLLDTGARASELCADPRRGAIGVLIQDYDEHNAKLRVMGKGNKERFLILSRSTQKALWAYLASRDHCAIDNLFTTNRGDPLTSSALLTLIKKLGNRAGVTDCHPHRFRHTFAITFLRNGGNVLELQQLLGHSTLKMVQHYARLAQVDLDTAMRRSSPVANWKL